MSSQFLCWATSQRRAVMSIRRQMSMSTVMAFSWILLSRSDKFWRGEFIPSHNASLTVSYSRTQFEQSALTLLTSPLKRTSSAFSCFTRRANSS